MLQIYVGYDSKEPVAWHVLAHSILRRASKPLSLVPVTLGSLAGLYQRARGPLESTEFSLSRFMVPYLSNYHGWSLFLDSDMLCLADITELFLQAQLDPVDRAVWVVKHNYTPKTGTKFLGQPQTAYPRKNWSSVMLFNNRRCQALTPMYVNEATPLDLHRFNWTKDELIGELSRDWNWLVGEYEPNPKAKLLHYTLGGPWFTETQTCDHADLWFAELDHMYG